MTEITPEPVGQTPDPEPAAQPPNPDRYKTLVVIFTVLTTVITAIIAGLQADANIRSSVDNRDSQVDAILAAGELHRQGLQSAYDTNVFTGYLKDSEEAIVLQLTALEQDQAGDKQASTASLEQAAVAQARSDTAKKFSIFFNDPRYAPKSADAMPDMQAYLTDSYVAANDLVAKQNAAADDYNMWNRKGDAYTSVLAILAVAFFLFGLAQALTPRLRLLFAIFGAVAMAGASLWTILILVG
jgi:hypothetical protein